MSRRLNFYRRLRSTVLALRTKSNDRIITDYQLLNPAVKEKGVTVSKSNSGKKRVLDIKKVYKLKSSGYGKK